MKPPQTRQIGGDRVVLGDDRLTVISHVDMPGWEVRKHRPAAILFDGRTWRVSGKTVGADKTIRYELQAWQPGDHDLTGPEIDYDADFVTLRDHTLAIGRQRSRMTGLLGLVMPLTGFLSARTKARLETVYGIDPTASTFRSVLVEGFCVLAGLVLYLFRNAFPGLQSPWFLPMVVVVAIDAAMRWDRILSEERPPPGFYEWLFRRRQPPRS